MADATLEDFRAEMAGNVRRIVMRVRIYADYTCADKVIGYTGSRVVSAEWVEEAHVPGTRRRLGECTVVINAGATHAGAPFVTDDADEMGTGMVRTGMALRLFMFAGGFERLCATYVIDSVESSSKGTVLHGTDVMAVLDISFSRYLSLTTADTWLGRAVTGTPAASRKRFAPRYPVTAIRDRVETLGMPRASVVYDQNPNGATSPTYTFGDDCTLGDAIMRMGPFYGADLVQQRDGTLKWQSQLGQVDEIETDVYGYGDAARSNVLTGVVYKDPADAAYSHSPSGSDLSDPLEVDALFLSLRGSVDDPLLTRPFRQ